jgi:hypothetical protein
MIVITLVIIWLLILGAFVFFKIRSGKNKSTAVTQGDDVTRLSRSISNKISNIV